jgi:hypothetical protein
MTKELIDLTNLQNNISRIKAGYRGIPDSIAVKMARAQVAKANGDNETADKLLNEFTAEIKKVCHGGKDRCGKSGWQLEHAGSGRIVTVLAADPVAAASKDHTAPDVSAAAENDVAPNAPVGSDTSVPNNAEIFAQTFGRPIGDQSWRYGGRGCVSDYGGCTISPTPSGHADNWGGVDNWRTSTPRQAPHARGRDWYDK